MVLALILARYSPFNSSLALRNIAPLASHGIVDQFLWAESAAFIALLTSCSPAMWTLAIT